MTRHQKYNQSAKGRARYANYRDTDKGRANERRVHLRWDTARRTRRLTDIKELLS